MDTINAIRVTDGARVPIKFEDRGDLVPAFDERGHRIEAYTSCITIGPDQSYIQLPKSAIPVDADLGEFRTANDIAAIRDLGYEFTMADVVRGD